MNPRLNVTQKTYYALGVLASVLNLAGGALNLAGIYAALLFNIASFLGGAMMLMMGAAEGVGSMHGKFCFAALALMILSLMGGVPAKLGGALTWPCFVFPYWRESAEGTNRRTVSFLVLLAGGIQLAGSFIPLPGRLKACLSIAIAACQLLFAWLLYSEEKERRA